jgi:septal ring factor EnvC (AmiA/AmiB activator)
MVAKVTFMEKQVEKSTKALSHLESTCREQDKTLSAFNKSIKGIQAKLDKLEHRHQKNGGPLEGSRKMDEISSVFIPLREGGPQSRFPTEHY